MSLGPRTCAGSIQSRSCFFCTRAQLRTRAHVFAKYVGLGRFARAELATIGKLLACGLAPHFRPAYDDALCRALSLGVAEEPAAAPRASDAAWEDRTLSFAGLVSLVWGEEHGT